MAHKLIPPEHVGARQPRSRGGAQQKYVLSEHGRRMILEHYDGSSEYIAYLQETLHVPRWVVWKWAAMLGKTRLKGRPWTKEEEDYVQNHLYHKRIPVMAKELNRSQASIRLKASNLGISRYEEGYTLRSLCAALGCESRHVRRWLEHGWLKGSRRGTGQESDAWYFSDASIRDLIRWHPQEIDARKIDQDRWLWLVDLMLGGRHGLGELDKPN